MHPRDAAQRLRVRRAPLDIATLHRVAVAATSTRTLISVPGEPPAAIGMRPPTAAWPVSDSVRPPALRASGSRRHSTHAVSLPSIVRCTRSHVVNGIRFSAAAARRPDRSRPRRTRRPAARGSAPSARDRRCDRANSDCAMGPEAERLMASPRIHSRRSRSTPGGSTPTRRRGDRSVSTSAAISPRRVAAASSCSRSVVRPDDRGPAISDSCPRGKPPRRQASSAAMSVAANADGVHALERRQRRRQRAIELARTKRGFENGTPGAHVFAIYSPQGENIAKRGDRSKR